MAAPTLVNRVSKTGPSGGGDTSAVDLTGSDLILLLTGSNSAVTDTPSNSAGHTFTALTRRTNTSAFGDAGQIFYVANPGGDISALVTNYAAASLFPAFEVEGWSFGGATVSLDTGSDKGNNNGNAASTTSKPGAHTPSVDDCLVVVCAAFEGTSPVSSIDGGFTIRFNQQLSGGTNFGCFVATLAQTTATAVDPTVTYAASNANNTNLAVFKGVGGGATIGGPILQGRAITPGRIFGGSTLMRQGLAWAEARERHIHQVERELRRAA